MKIRQIYQRRKKMKFQKILLQDEGQELFPVKNPQGKIRF